MTPEELKSIRDQISTRDRYDKTQGDHYALELCDEVERLQKLNIRWAQVVKAIHETADKASMPDVHYLDCIIAMGRIKACCDVALDPSNFNFHPHLPAT